MYQQALKEAGYEHNLTFKKPVPKTKQRVRKTLWFNPPFSKNVSTNLTVAFRNLLAKHFPKNTLMGKLFNNNNTKLSYSCMPNIDQIMAAHNKKVLAENKDKMDTKTCSCTPKPPSNTVECPLDGNCLEKGIVYEATASTEDGEVKTYIGAASTTFKARLYNHHSSFTMVEKRNQTSLSSYVWRKREEGMEVNLTYRVLAKAPAYSADRGKCLLCLQEKVQILLADEGSCLNRRSELHQKCRHRHKHTLQGWTPET